MSRPIKQNFDDHLPPVRIEAELKKKFIAECDLEGVFYSAKLRELILLYVSEKEADRLQKKNASGGIIICE